MASVVLSLANVSAPLAFDTPVLFYSTPPIGAAVLPT